MKVTSIATLFYHTIQAGRSFPKFHALAEFRSHTNNGTEIERKFEQHMHGA